MCYNCFNIPKIELINNEYILISCPNCNITDGGNYENILLNIINHTSKWNSNIIKYCSSLHEKKIPTNIYCKTHNLFLCNDCFHYHIDKYSLSKLINSTIGDLEDPKENSNIIRINFSTNINNREILDLNFLNTTHLNEVFKIFIEKINLPKNSINELIFLLDGNKLDIKSEKSLSECGIINNQIIIVMYDLENNHEIINLFNLRKNICIYHNKKFMYYCLQCNNEMCQQCLENHNFKYHSIEKMENNKYSFNNNFEKYENLIIKNENKKKEIYNAIKENIKILEKSSEDDINEINLTIEKMIKKFYLELEKGQNLAFFSKILFDTYMKIDKKDDKKILYKNLIKQINNFFNDEKVKEFNIVNFPIIYDYKKIFKCIYHSNFNFIPQIKLKYNDIKLIDKEIIDSLINKCNEIFNNKKVYIIDIRKGSLSIVIALNYLIKEKIEMIDSKNKKVIDILEELNEYLGIETKNIKNILKDKLFIAQKDKQFKPDFAIENLYDLASSPDELVKNISKHKNNNDDTNIFEISKAITINDIKNFFDFLEQRTKETHDNLYDQILNDANNELQNYLQIFDEQFEEALKNSIFEYNTKYIAYIYRYDEKYNSGKSACNNIKTKILFHGTNSCCISKILTSQFKDAGVAIFGPGVYFSDLLDYTWYYADDSEKNNNRKNFNRIPEIKETFSFIVSFSYYDKDKFEQVYDNSTINMKVPDYGIRHILVDYNSAAISKNEINNYNKFKGTEYLISNKNQILPFLSITVERMQYLIVWRDNNFNESNPNCYYKYEKMLEYNNKMKNYAAFNFKTKIYYFNESEEALTFIKRKKYNKILLISNAGNGGCNFIEEARKIIGNNTIAMITCYLPLNYFKEVKNMENVLLNSSEYDCMKEFLWIFFNENLNAMKNLQKKLEEKYQQFDPYFNFKEINENAFNFPNFKEGGKFEELVFPDNFITQENKEDYVEIKNKPKEEKSFEDSDFN